MGLENNPLENSERVLPQQILQPSDSSEDEEENETDFAPSGYALLPRHWFEAEKKVGVGSVCFC